MVDNPVYKILGYITEILLLSISEPLVRFVVLLNFDTLQADDESPYL